MAALETFFLSATVVSFIFFVLTRFFPVGAGALRNRISNLRTLLNVEEETNIKLKKENEALKSKLEKSTQIGKLLVTRATNLTQELVGHKTDMEKALDILQTAISKTRENFDFEDEKENERIIVGDVLQKLFDEALCNPNQGLREK